MPGKARNFPDTRFWCFTFVAPIARATNTGEENNDLGRIFPTLGSNVGATKASRYRPHPENPSTPPILPVWRAATATRPAEPKHPHPDPLPAYGARENSPRPAG